MGAIPGNCLGPLLQCSLNDYCLCIGLAQTALWIPGSWSVSLNTVILVYCNG